MVGFLISFFPCIATRHVEETPHLMIIYDTFSSGESSAIELDWLENYQAALKLRESDPGVRSLMDGAPEKNWPPSAFSIVQFEH